MGSVMVEGWRCFMGCTVTLNFVTAPGAFPSSPWDTQYFIAQTSFERH